MSELKIGDRVLVQYRTHTQAKRFAGKIVGQTKNRAAWCVLRDGNRWPTPYHKRLCSEEPIEVDSDA